MMKNSVSSVVYEIDTGWSFDGSYIPHYLELNWFFGDNPVDNTGLQKIRIHGLAKGKAKLSAAINGMEPSFMDYESYFTEPQYIDLPRTDMYVTDTYFPVTNYVDVAGRGISIQMRFEGRDNSEPEPSHVIQALVLQTSPAGTGARTN